jgi:hypothetical protein
VLRVLAVLWLVGCRGVFGIGTTVLEGDAPGSDDVDAASDANLCGDEDWDGDGRGDGCDPCPMLASASADHDTDGDGIGDGCDPRPDQAGDSRLLWNGFTLPASIATWTTTGGTWTVSGGKLVQSDPTAIGRLQINGSYASLYLMTQIDVLTQGISPQVGICAYVSPGDFKCCDVNNDSGTGLMAWDAATTVTNSWPGSFANGATFELDEQATDTMHTCHVRQQLADTSVTLPTTQPPGVFVLHVRQITVAYRYLFVVQMPP